MPTAYVPSAPVSTSLSMSVPSTTEPSPFYSGSLAMASVPTSPPVPSVRENVFLLLSQCPFPFCLASFPEDYKALRLHLAREHLNSNLKAGDLDVQLMKFFYDRLKSVLTTQCPQIGCDYSATNLTDMMRKVHALAPALRYFL